MSCGEKWVEGRVGHEAGRGCVEKRGHKGQDIHQAQLVHTIPTTRVPWPKEAP